MTNLNNDGAGSLRQTIRNANTNTDASNQISFQGGLSGIIDLESTLSSLQKVLDIASPQLGAITLNRKVIAGAPPFGLVYVDMDATVHLSNLTFTNGNGGLGGAIENQGTLTVFACDIHHNIARFDGGAIGNMGTLTVAGSLIHHNSARRNGGGIYTAGTGSVYVILGTSVFQNTATGEGGGFWKGGGGAFNVGSGCTLVDNTAKVGGGVYANGSVSFTDVLIGNNNGTTKGGGVYLKNGTLTLLRCELTGNQSPKGPGVCYVAGTTLDITDCMVGPGQDYTLDN